MRRAIQDATACREALLRLPKLGLGELRQQWRVLYKAEASPYLSRELLLRAVAYRMQEVALGGLRPAQRRLRQYAQEFKETEQTRRRARPELKPGTRLIASGRAEPMKWWYSMTASLGRARVTARFPPSRERSPAPRGRDRSSSD
jgi:Protein of unknown function (DUF2924)